MNRSPGRAHGRGPDVLLDHVLVPLPDLGAAADEFAARHGLVALPGGRHPGAGTANRLVPLGGTYLELIAVVDTAEAATLPRSQRVLEALRAGRPFATWAARTHDLAGLKARLEGQGWTLPPAVPGSRRRPDGRLLEWTTQELAPASVASALPFVIEWRVAPGEHPGEAPAAHPGGAGGIVHLVFEAPEPVTLRRRLDVLFGGGLSFEIEAGETEQLVAIELERPGGRQRIP